MEKEYIFVIIMAFIFILTMIRDFMSRKEEIKSYLSLITEFQKTICKLNDKLMARNLAELTNHNMFVKKEMQEQEQENEGPEDTYYGLPVIEEEPTVEL